MVSGDFPTTEKNVDEVATATFNQYKDMGASDEVAGMARDTAREVLLVQESQADATKGSDDGMGPILWVLLLQERRLAAAMHPKKCFLCGGEHWLKDCPHKKFSEGCFVCGAKDHLAQVGWCVGKLLGRSSDSPRAPKVELIPFGRDNGLFLFPDLISDQQRLGPLRCLVDTGCCSNMVAEKVLPKGVTIRPVAGPALMTIDRSICKIVGVVSLTVEVYDCDNARQGIHPGEDEPRIPFPVSALVVDSLAYDVILGHDFLNGSS
ncbi:hypothetical protein FOZ60_010059 [Perkinsus olseni]|uniref:Uncharacterized protein n=1 Tax=Perkinsus olseni TaxID=32597 RepID=A0A7J6NG74_PEROL|nr:hypothetical protein FOZ60_010059 [Perkinsus olseni]